MSLISVDPEDVDLIQRCSEDAAAAQPSGQLLPGDVTSSSLETTSSGRPWKPLDIGLAVFFVTLSGKV